MRSVAILLLFNCQTSDIYDAFVCCCQDKCYCLPEGICVYTIIDRCNTILQISVVIS